MYNGIILRFQILVKNRRVQAQEPGRLCNQPAVQGMPWDWHQAAA